jgi:hypothetical protein
MMDKHTDQMLTIAAELREEGQGDYALALVDQVMPRPVPRNTLGRRVALRALDFLAWPVVGTGLVYACYLIVGLLWFGWTWMVPGDAQWIFGWRQPLGFGLGVAGQIGIMELIERYVGKHVDKVSDLEDADQKAEKHWREELPEWHPEHTEPTWKREQRIHEQWSELRTRSHPLPRGEYPGAGEPRVRVILADGSRHLLPMHKAVRDYGQPQRKAPTTWDYRPQGDADDREWM